MPDASSRVAGLLPNWGTAPLPPPPLFTLPNVLRTVGPGIIGLGLAIGSGEWLLGPSVIVSYGPALLWITTVSVLLQVVLNLEMARYTLYTGEPIVTGYMRTWPGPGFWGVLYSLFAFLQYGWPGWALASATATAALVLGRMPGDGDAGLVKLFGYVTFGACFVVVTLGRKVERTLELTMWVLVALIIVYLTLIDVSTVSGENWTRVARGFLSVGTLPSGADWLLLGAFAAYSGLGGIGNVFITNWMRDKGYGMAATVGYIPTALSGRVPLASHGNVFAVTPGALGVWRDWWRFVHVDQWGVFFLGSMAGMGLTALLTVQYVPAGTGISGWAVANFQAEGIARVHGTIFWYITLLCGLWILFSTQMGIVDGLPRSVTDILWSGSAAARRKSGGDVRKVYYSALLVMALWGCVALNLAQPLTLIILGANMAAVTFVFISFHTIVVNRRFLPRELRSSVVREVILVLCALFYGAFVVTALVRYLA